MQYFGYISATDKLHSLSPLYRQKLLKETDFINNKKSNNLLIFHIHSIYRYNVKYICRILLSFQIYYPEYLIFS